MLSISPENIFRGSYAWEKSLPQITKLTKSPLILGRSVQTRSLRNKIFKDLKNEELKQYFRPEFLNRLDEIIVFRQLTKNEVKEIAEIMLREVFARLQDKGIKLDVTDAFKERLVEEGYNPSYGARP